MADHPDHPDHPDVPDLPGHLPGQISGGDGDRGVPQEGAHFGTEGNEETAPRRAASAEFVVQSSVGSDALLREAMDPANQSLADALRLSFRVLQAVILVLVVLFIFSGFQTVEEGQSGVLLRWGKILEVNGSQALAPGLKFSKWPYPAGEFVLFKDNDREVRLTRQFWPDMKGETLAKAIESATVNGALSPGKDGSLLTKGGDIAHLFLVGRYDIDMPERYVTRVEDENRDPRRLDADKLVELALARAAVHYAASRSLAEFIDFSEASKGELAALAQDMLDDVDAGVRIKSVDSPIDPTPALAIKRAYGAVQEARVQADEQVENARQDAHKALLAAAGNSYPALVGLIDHYEDAFEVGDDTTSETLLTQINELLESEDTSGEVATILGYANAYRSTIERTLGQETTRFLSHRDAYREHPEFEIGRLWLETYGRVLSRADTEIIYAPANGGTINVALAGLTHIREDRRKQMLQDKETKTWMDFGSGRGGPYIPWAEDSHFGRPGRQLNKSGTGSFSGR